MQLDTITMPRLEARREYLKYRNAIREAHRQELDELRQRQLTQDQAIARAYRHLSIGNQLIRLSNTILSTGFDDQYRPRMAVVRADAQEVWMKRWASGEINFMPFDERSRQWESRIHWSKLIRLQGQPDDRIGNRDYHSIEAVATVPSIPPEFRPDHHLRNYHLLWEATWRSIGTARRAPQDPALIKWLGGDMWAVLAIWDLTEVERAALEAGHV